MYKCNCICMHLYVCVCICMYMNVNVCIHQGEEIRDPACHPYTYIIHTYKNRTKVFPHD